MNRRSFVANALLGAAAIPLFDPRASSVRKYGRVNVQEDPRLARKMRVLVNGVDVSTRCFEADDIEGYALCYRADRNGRFHVDEERREIVTERVTGEVVLKMRV